MSDRREEIRQRLEARMDRSADTPGTERAKARAVFQRHAPDDVRHLLGEVDRMQTVVDAVQKYVKVANDYHDGQDAWRDLCAALNTFGGDHA